MIQWVKEKFTSAVSFFYVLTVIAWGVSGAIAGYGMASAVGLILGGALGVLLGIIIGILFFGFIATVINISDTCDLIYEKLNAAPNNSSANNFTSSIVNSTEPESYKICKKCGAKNPVSSTTCKDCGEYL